MPEEGARGAEDAGQDEPCLSAWVQAGHAWRLVTHTEAWDLARDLTRMISVEEAKHVGCLVEVRRRLQRAVGKGAFQAQGRAA